MPMPAPNQIRFIVEPRLVPPTKAARRLHLTLAEFNLKREALYRAGFPQACSVTGHYDIKAIDEWLDRRSGVASEGAPDTIDGQDATAYMMARIAEL